MNAAGTLADPKATDDAQRQAAEAAFRQLYWGGLATVEDANVEKAMFRFKQCLDGDCDDENGKIENLRDYSRELARQCRLSMSTSWTLGLIDLPDRRKDDR